MTLLREWRGLSHLLHAHRRHCYVHNLAYADVVTEGDVLLPLISAVPQSFEPSLALTTTALTSLIRRSFSITSPSTLGLPPRALFLAMLPFSVLLYTNILCSIADWITLQGMHLQPTPVANPW